MDTALFKEHFFLGHTDSFPLETDCMKSFEKLKSVIAKSAIYAIDDKMPFTVGTDASEHSLAATVSRDSWSIALYSRTLNKSEQNHSAI